MLAQFKLRALLYCKGTAINVQVLKELAKHLDGLGTCNQCQVGELGKNPGNQSGMVRLHVMDNQVVGLAAGKSLHKVCLPVIGLTGIGGIHYCYLVIKDKV